MKESNSLWSKIIGHQQLIERLKNDIDGDKVAHAYLFSGPAGIGKRLTALTFAAALNCRPAPEYSGEAPCGRCSSCRALAADHHPDTYTINPAGNFINIEQIRDIRRLISLKSYQSAYKLIILNNADRLNKPAANCLLKILEEPPPAVVFVLISANDALLPATVISRCRRLDFRRLAAADISHHLIEKLQLEKEAADIIAAVSRGIFARALSLAADESFIKRRRHLLGIISGLKTSNPGRISLAVADLFKQLKAESADLKARLQAEGEEILSRASTKTEANRLKKQLAKAHKRELAHFERRAVNDIINSLSYLYRDVALLASGGQPELLTNYDGGETLRELAASIKASGALAALSRIRETRKYIYANINPELAVEDLFHNLQEV